MTTLTLTNTNPSSLIVGDPGHVTVSIPPKETKTLEVNEAQLKFLMPQLEQLKAAKWLEYSVSEGAPAPASVVPVVAAPVVSEPVVPPKVDDPLSEETGEETAPEGGEETKE